MCNILKKIIEDLEDQLWQVTFKYDLLGRFFRWFFLNNLFYVYIYTYTILIEWNYIYLNFIYRQ